MLTTTTVEGPILYPKNVAITTTTASVTMITIVILNGNEIITNIINTIKIIITTRTARETLIIPTIIGTVAKTTTFRGMIPIQAIRINLMNDQAKLLPKGRKTALF
jgi:hypothetical protein